MKTYILLRSVDGKTLTLWGNVSDESGTLDILPSYLLDDDGHPNRAAKKKKR